MEQFTLEQRQLLVKRAKEAIGGYKAHLGDEKPVTAYDVTRHLCALGVEITEADVLEAM